MADQLERLERDLAKIEVAMRHADAGDMEAFAVSTADLAETVATPAAEETSPADGDQSSEPFASR